MRPKQAMAAIGRGAHFCCFSKCCPCINLAFFKSKEGMMKLAEVILGSVCQNLLMNYGIVYALTLGSSFYSFITATSASTMTSFVLLICYVISPSTLYPLRSSLFELLFNVFACMLYFASSCYLAFAVHTYLYAVHKFISLFQMYPAMSATYVAGFVLSGVHGYDAYLAYNT